MGGSCSTHITVEKCVILIRQLEGRGLLGRLRFRWEDNIRLDVREGRWEVVDWIRLARDRD